VCQRSCVPIHLRDFWTQLWRRTSKLRWRLIPQRRNIGASFAAKVAGGFRQCISCVVQQLRTQTETSKTRGNKFCGSSSKLNESQVGKPKSIMLVKASTSHQMEFLGWQLLVGTMLQDMVSKTGKLNDPRSKSHFQMRAKWNMQWMKAEQRQKLVEKSTTYLCADALTDLRAPWSANAIFHRFQSHSHEFKVKPLPLQGSLGI